MELKDFLDYVKKDKPILKGSEEYAFMMGVTEDTRKIASQIAEAYDREKLSKLFSQLIGKPVDEGFGLFPPFFSDFGKNITIGNNVFINSGCKFQDQGGITIGDNALIGHNVVLSTLNHGFQPQDRPNLYPKPIVIGDNVWIGANATVVPGVTIGDNVIVAAGAVVTKDIPSNMVCGGVPAKVLRHI